MLSKQLIFLIIISFCSIQKNWSQADKVENFDINFLVTKISEVNGLQDNFVSDFDIDENGVMWLVTRKGLIKYYNDEFEIINEATGPFQYNGVMVDEKGNLWLTKRLTETWRPDQLVIFNPQLKKLIKLEEYVQINGLIDTSTDRLITFDYNGIYLIYNQNTEQTLQIVNDALILANNQSFVETKMIVRDYADFGHEVFSSKNNVNPQLTINDKLIDFDLKYVLSIDNFQRITINHKSTGVSFTANSSLVFLDLFNDMLVLNSQSNLFFMDTLGKQYFDIKSRYSDVFENLTITKVERLGDVFWLATSNGFFKLEKRKFNSILDDRFLSIRDIIERNERDLLIASEKGVFLYNRESLTVNVVTDEGYYYGLYKISENEFLALGNTNIVTRLSYVNGNWIRKDNVFEGDNQFFINLFKTKNGDLLAASEIGITRYDIESNTINSIEQKGINFFDFTYSREQEYLFALGESGLLKMNESKGTSDFIPYFNDQVIAYIHSDKVNPSLYWVATKFQGLIKWDEKQNLFEHITVNEGLSNNNVHSIYEDDQQRLWMSTDYGISVLDKKNNQVDILLSEDGLHENEMNRHSFYFDDKGNVYFGSVNGIVNFNVNDFTFQERGFNDPIKHVRYYDQNSKKFIEHNLKLSENSFSIKKGFLQAQIILKEDKPYVKEVFRYKFFNDEGWTNVENNIIDLSSLKPGESVIYIQEQVGPNNWTIPFSLSIFQYEPFYKSTSFFILIFMLFSLIILIYLINENVKKKKLNDKIQRKINEKTEELETKNKKLEATKTLNDNLFSIISHDLRSPLISMNKISDSIHFFRKEKDFETVEKLSESIESSASNVLNTVDRLLDWSVVQRNNIKSYSNFQVKEEIQKVVKELHATIANKSLAIDFKTDTTFEIHADKGSFYILMYNLLSNAIKFSYQNEKIDVIIENSFDKNVIMIKDYGVGISNDIINQVNESTILTSKKGTANETGLGLGLKICNEICVKMGWDFIIYNKNGTLISIHFP